MPAIGDPVWRIRSPEPDVVGAGPLGELVDEPFGTGLWCRVIGIDEEICQLVNDNARRELGARIPEVALERVQEALAAVAGRAAATAARGLREHEPSDQGLGSRAAAVPGRQLVQEAF